MATQWEGPNEVRGIGDQEYSHQSMISKSVPKEGICMRVPRSSMEVYVLVIELLV